MIGFASATHAEKRKGVSPELLEKIWRIDNKTAKKTIRTTTQLNRYVLGRCLGPAKNEGNKMTQWVLKQNGQIVPRRTMRRLTPEERAREIEIKKISEFNDAIKARYGDSFSLPYKTLENPQDEDDTGDLIAS